MPHIKKTGNYIDLTKTHRDLLVMFVRARIPFIRAQVNYHVIVLSSFDEDEEVSVVQVEPIVPIKRLSQLFQLNHMF